MEATDILSSEHRVIERVIAALEAGAVQIDEGGEVRPEFFIEAAAFIAGFADGCHHRKEEGVLFTTMEQYGVPNQGGPIGVMLLEHEQGRRYTRGLRAAAERLQQGDAGARKELVQNALGYAQLLRQHIYKEDHILFPLAGQVIPTDQHITVLEGFERVEHAETGEGVHEKYLALAESLEQEAAPWRQA